MASISYWTKSVFLWIVVHVNHSLPVAFHCTSITFSWGFFVFGFHVLTFDFGYDYFQYLAKYFHAQWSIEFLFVHKLYTIFATLRIGYVIKPKNPVWAPTSDRSTVRPFDLQLKKETKKKRFELIKYAAEKKATLPPSLLSTSKFRRFSFRHFKNFICKLSSHN